MHENVDAISAIPNGNEIKRTAFAVFVNKENLLKFPKYLKQHMEKML